MVIQDFFKPGLEPDEVEDQRSRPFDFALFNKTYKTFEIQEWSKETNIKSWDLISFLIGIGLIDEDGKIKSLQLVNVVRKTVDRNYIIETLRLLNHLCDENEEFKLIGERKFYQRLVSSYSAKYS